MSPGRKNEITNAISFSFLSFLLVSGAGYDRKPFFGKRILLVEDEHLVADETVLSQGRPIDAAVLDINLRGARVFKMADRLMVDGVPFVFATGYDNTINPARFDHVPRCAKPVAPETLAKALLEVVDCKC